MTNWRKETLRIKDLLPCYQKEIEEGADELVIIPQYRELAAKRIERSHKELWHYAVKMRKVVTEGQYQRVMRAVYADCEMNNILVE